MRYLAFIYSEDDNSAYNVIFPDLEGCCTFGESFEEAVEMAEEAMFGWLETYKENSSKYPKPNKLAYFTDDKKRELEIPLNAIPQFIEYKQPKAERINITIRSDILKEIDNYTKSHHISRSAFLQEAAVKAIYKLHAN